MAALTGTNLVANLWKTGQRQIAVGSYTLVGAITNADTLTWDNIMPDGTKTIVGFRFYGQELDTNVTPTLAATIGDENTATGFMTSFTAGSSLAQFTIQGNGAFLGATSTGRDIILVTSGTLGTAAASGTVYVAVEYICGDVTA